MQQPNADFLEWCRQTFTAAWVANGRPRQDGIPFLTGPELHVFLRKKMLFSRGLVRVYTRTRLVTPLIQDGFITPLPSGGWFISAQVYYTPITREVLRYGDAF